MLQNRRKRHNEDFKEYLYSLMEIGKQIRIDDISLTECFIEAFLIRGQIKVKFIK